jgi:hypothetical protein
MILTMSSANVLNGWRISHNWLIESEFYVMTDGQSVSLSWNKAPIWGLRPDFYYCQTVAGLLLWGALCDERTGLSFTIAAGLRQRSHSRFRILWDSWPCFTISNSRLPFSSPHTTRRAMVEVFDPASIRDKRSSTDSLLQLSAYLYNILARTA